MRGDQSRRPLGGGTNRTGATLEGRLRQPARGDRVATCPVSECVGAGVRKSFFPRKGPSMWGSVAASRPTNVRGRCEDCDAHCVLRTFFFPMQLSSERWRQTTRETETRIKLHSHLRNLVPHTDQGARPRLGGSHDPFHATIQELTPRWRKDSVRILNETGDSTRTMRGNLLEQNLRRPLKRAGGEAGRGLRKCVAALHGHHAGT